MWLLPLIAISIAIRLNGAKKYHLNEDSIPRYVIPHPEERQQSASLPEAVVKKSGSIVGTELPGAYGEDFELDPFESGSGISGSGSSGEKADVIFVARSGEDLETAGKFGNNDAPVPPNNPVTAFTNDEKEEEEDDEDVEAAQAVSKPKKQVSKTDTSAPTVKDATEKQAKTSKPEGTKKTTKVKKTEKTKKHKSSTKRTKAKAKSNVAPPSSDENNMISKIDAIARQIERVEHKEKLDRKEEATLKVAKKVAKKVIKDIAAKKQKAKIVKEVSNMIEKPAVQIAVQPAPTTAKKENAAAAEVKVQDPNDQGESPGDEASEIRESEDDSDCPWGCFWKCQSYCPNKCCNNPYNCDLSCREFCAPNCPTKCCAPGSKRLPKLKINFLTESANTINANTSNPAESSYQQEKERSEKMNLVHQIDALKKTTIYAAQLMGLPSECPLACARICLPGLCHHDCCGKGHVIGPPLSCPISCSDACYPGLCTGQCCTRPPPPKRSSTAQTEAQTFLQGNPQDTPRPLVWNKNPYIRTINEDVMTEKLLKGKILLPDTDQYKALMLISQLTKPQIKELLKKTVVEKKLIKKKK